MLQQVLGKQAHAERQVAIGIDQANGVIVAGRIDAAVFCQNPHQRALRKLTSDDAFADPYQADTALGEVAPTRCGHAFFGTDKCVFATDAPFDSEQGRGLMRNTVGAVNALEIPQAEKDVIFSGNAKRLLRL